MQSLKVLKGRYNDRPLTAKEFQQCQDELKERVLSNGAAKKIDFELYLLYNQRSNYPYRFVKNE